MTPPDIDSVARIRWRVIHVRSCGYAFMICVLVNGKHEQPCLWLRGPARSWGLR